MLLWLVDVWLLLSVFVAVVGDVGAVGCGCNSCLLLLLCVVIAY